ncbi:hypothetical protein HGA91_01765 [candidate division WWE3 bacterium]|nr:hypothetical protein [candidate division WWE3 bacterium]
MRRDIDLLVEQNIADQRLFHSPTYGDLTFKEVIFHIGTFMHNRPSAIYDVVLGSDSQVYSDRVDFVSAIIVHRRGEGGIYFWKRNREEHRKYVLRDRMYHEAVLSMDLANDFMEQFKIEGIIKFNLEIHVDVSHTGKTREVINEVVGMVRGSGFIVKTKPEAFGAASVADKHT